MAYAEVEDLRSRAGRLADAWDETTTPNTGDLERYLRDASDEIDVALAGAGFDVPITSPVGAASLRTIVAELALETALTRTWPGGSGPQAVRDLLGTIDATVTAWRTALADGTLAVLKLLRSQDTQQVAGAAAFWDSSYSAVIDDLESGRLIIDNATGVGATWRTPIGPEIHKGQRL